MVKAIIVLVLSIVSVVTADVRKTTSIKDMVDMKYDHIVSAPIPDSTDAPGTCTFTHEGEKRDCRKFYADAHIRSNDRLKVYYRVGDADDYELWAEGEGDFDLYTRTHLTGLQDNFFWKITCNNRVFNCYDVELDLGMYSYYIPTVTPQPTGPTRQPTYRPTRQPTYGPTRSLTSDQDQDQDQATDQAADQAADQDQDKTPWRVWVLIGGGVAGLFLLGVFLFWYVRRMRQGQRKLTAGTTTIGVDDL